MSTYVVSDIHGCNLAFRKALKSIKLKKRDTLFVLGDLIDRGSDSKGVLDTVFLLLDHGFDIRCIKGNHEQMMLDSFDDITQKVNWMKNGGKETLKSFLTSDLEKVPAKYIDFINSLPYYYNQDKFIFVHAAVNMKIEDPYSDVRTLLWERKWERVYDENWLGDRKVIHGHTPTLKKEIVKTVENENPIICVDNGSYMNNRDGYSSMCILNLDSMTVHFENKLENGNS